MESLEEDVFYSELVCMATTFSDTEGTTHSSEASLRLYHFVSFSEIAQQLDGI